MGLSIPARCHVYCLYPITKRQGEELAGFAAIGLHHLPELTSHHGVRPAAGYDSLVPRGGSAVRCLFVFSSINGPVVVGFYKLAFFVNYSDCGDAIQPFGWTL